MEKKITLTVLFTLTAIGCLSAADIQNPQISVTNIAFPQETSPEEQKLFYAVINGDYDYAMELLVKKTNPNVRDIFGRSPLHYAQSLRMIKLLVKHGADVNAQDNQGIARLHIDVVYGNTRSVKYLLEHNARPNIPTNYGVTPLHLSTSIAFFENPGLRTLKKVAVPLAGIGAGTIVGAATVAVVTGATVGAGAAAGIALSFVTSTIASTLGSKEADITIEAIITAINITERLFTLKQLLARGANPNAQDAAGNTPLHYLAEGTVFKQKIKQGGILMAKYLILKGAQRDKTNNDGQTPYDVAKENKRFLLMPVLSPSLPRPLEKTLKRLAPKGVKASLY